MNGIFASTYTAAGISREAMMTVTTLIDVMLSIGLPPPEHFHADDVNIT